jgi:hypothetical protein
MTNDFIDKIKLYVSQNAFRLVGFGALAGFILVFVYAFHIEMKNTGPEELVFPGGLDATGRPSIQEGNNAGGLAVQNLSADELSVLISALMGEALTFPSGDMAQVIDSVGIYFTPEGLRQYQDFLSSSGLRSTISTGQYTSASFVEREPLEVTRGAFNGRFKWVFDVPTTISFSNPDGSIAENRKITFRLQFTRVPDPEDPEAVRVEIWQALPGRRS